MDLSREVDGLIPGGVRVSTLQDWPWADDLDLETAPTRSSRRFDNSGFWYESGCVAALALDDSSGVDLSSQGNDLDGRLPKPRPKRMENPQHRCMERLKKLTLRLGFYTTT